MNAIFFYISLPFIYLVSLLPFWVLYRLSDLCFLLLYYVIGYRKRVVLTNLRNAFPEKPEQEIRRICRRFFSYLCDLTLETLKTLTIGPRSVKKHVLMRDKSVFEQLKKANQSAIIVMGHFGNWELGGARFAVEELQKLIIIYHPLRNKHFDNLMYKMRTRLGNGLYTMKNTLRAMLRDREQLTITAFIADQTPANLNNAFWMDFLNQETPIFTGPEKIAQKLKYPIVYVSLKRIRRGLYDLESELLVPNPADTQENEISTRHIRRLEQDIREQPEIWLWTHRRWKHKRPKTEKENRAGET